MGVLALLLVSLTSHAGVPVRALVSDFFDASLEERRVILRTLRDPAVGPADLVDEALKAILDNPPRYAHHGRLRLEMLMFVNDRIPAQMAISARKKQSIYRRAKVLLEMFPTVGLNQEETVRLFERLQLWTPDQVPFLAYKSFGGGEDRWLPRLIEVFTAPGLEERQLILTRARKQTPRSLASYALAYQTGLMERADLNWLLRLALTEASATALPNLAEKANPRTLQQRALDRQRVADLIDDVLADVQARWRAGDELVRAAVDDLRKTMPGRKLSMPRDAFVRKLTGVEKLCADDL